MEGRGRVNPSSNYSSTSSTLRNTSSSFGQTEKRAHFTLKSTLTPEQLRVLALYHSCGVKLDNKTFSSIWKLVNLGIPPNVIVDLLRDINQYKK